MFIKKTGTPISVLPLYFIYVNFLLFSFKKIWDPTLCKAFKNCLGITEKIGYEDYVVAIIIQCIKGRIFPNLSLITKEIMKMYLIAF